MPIGVPQRERIVHYARRGGGAVVDLMTWPVAVAVGLGTMALDRWAALRAPAARTPAPSRTTRRG